MRHARQREWSVEDADAYMAATDNREKIAKAADEEGGPQLSLVPAVERNEVWPTDLLPPAADPAATAEPAAAEPAAAEPFDGVPLTGSRKRAGWSAERQRLFLAALAETGSVHLASATARLTARSAYALRARSPAFAQAWDTAEQLAVGRLSAPAFDRAINGRTEQLWQEGELVAEKRLPSDRMLMWLLARLDPRRFASAWEKRGDTADPQAAAHQAFPDQLARLADVPAE
jgi:hypothetical protein